MQFSLTDRAHWPLWLGTALVATVLGAMWWQPAHEDAVAPAPAPVQLAVAPAPVRSSAPITPARPAPALKLVGTVAAGANSFATVLHTADSQVLQLRVGDHVDGYAVTAIEPGRLVLDGAAQPLVIEPERTAAASASPMPSVATPAAPQVEQPNYPEGEAPWDLAPPFRH